MKRKKLIVGAMVFAIGTVGGITAVRALTAPPYGTVRGVVAIVGDSNVTYGARYFAEQMTPSQVGYVPILLSANGASVRWDGCMAPPNPCPDPTATDYWARRLPQARQRVNPDAYVIELGINDAGAPGTSDDRGYSYYSLKIDYLMRLLPTNRPVLWTNLPCQIEPASYRAGCLNIDNALSVAHARWPNLTTLNWAAVANSHPEYMNQIGADIHYSGLGNEAYVNFFVAALNAKLPFN